MSNYYTDRGRREQLTVLESLRAQMGDSNGHAGAVGEIEWRMEELRAVIENEPYVLDRRFLFRTLSMGHSQFAELVRVVPTPKSTPPARVPHRP
jgi:hypothetical protein